MPKAHEVASELRKLADSLDREPEADISRPSVFFNTGAKKSEFLNLARLFPHPFIKQQAPYFSGKLEILYKTPGAEIKAWIERSEVCRLVRPAQEAEYECEPIFSQVEEESLGETA